jgi:hypothetical protein
MPPAFCRRTGRFRNVRVLRNLSVVLLSVIVGAFGLAVVAPMAGATNGSSPYGTLKVSDLTTNATRCVTEKVEFVPGSTLVDWQLTVEVNDSNGDLFVAFTLNAISLTRSFTLCPGRDVAGYFQVSGYLQGTTAPTPPGSGCCDIATYTDSEFTFRVIDRKPTALAVKVTRSHSTTCPLRKTRHCSRVSGKLTRVGKPLPWEWVQIQAYKRGKWARLAWGHCDGLGRVSWYVTISRKETRLKFRLHYDVHDYAKASTSRAFKLEYRATH